MPLQSRAAQGFAGAAVKIDLTLKGIKTQHPAQQHNVDHIVVKTDLIQKGLKLGKVFFIRLAGENNGRNRPDS